MIQAKVEKKKKDNGVSHGHTLLEKTTNWKVFILRHFNSLTLNASQASVPMLVELLHEII